jgi:two-component system, cell cycle sensor histidine kinase and response regulator CckA
LSTPKTKDAMRKDSDSKPPTHDEMEKLRRENAALISQLKGQEDLRYALAVHKALADAILDVSTDIILLLDDSGLVLTVNRNGAARLGAGVENMQGENIFHFLPKDVVTERRRRFLKAVESGEPVTYKDKHRDVTWSHRLFPCFDPLTDATRVAVISRDISESEMAFEALHKSEARYRAMVELQVEAVCRWLPDMTLTYVNRGYCRYFGGTPENLMGKSFLDHVPEDSHDAVVALADSIIKNPRVATLEILAVREDGEPLWLEWSTCPILDAQDRVLEFQSVGRDVTKRKRTERELRDQRAFLSRIIDTVPNLIFVKNSEGKYTLANKAEADMYQTTTDALVGKDIHDLAPNPEEAALIMAEDLEVLRTGRPAFVPQRAITNAVGEKRWFATVKLPLADRGEVLGVAVDITDRREAEAERATLEKQIRQSQKMQALGTLAGGIAHDFNNMLFAILGFTRLGLKRCPDDEALQEYLAQIQKAAERSADLVRQILTFSRQTEPEKRTVHLVTLIKEVAALLGATLPTEIEIRTVLKAERDAVLGDPSQIHQVVMNLCTNATQAMRDKGGLLEISLLEVRATEWPEATDQELPSGPCLELRIRDTGPGMDQETLDKIFDPFFTTKGPGEGTGMGLSVAHGIVQGHDGVIHVESRPGQGSLFRVLLPLHHANGDENAESEFLASGTEHILFVDDEQTIVQMAEDMLTQLGYRVTALTTPDEALNQFQATPEKFDLMITDLTMPAMTGKSLAEKILKKRPTLPIILLTGYCDHITPEKAKEIGIHCLLMKPVVEEQLARAVRNALDTKDI